MAEDDDDSQKTEDPTPRKLEESRKRGQVALSREVNNWIMILAATLLITSLSAGILADLRDYLRMYIEQAHNLPMGQKGIGITLEGAFVKVLSVLALPLLALMVAAFLGPFVQVGPLFAPEVIKLDLGKLSPMKGFGRLFSMRAIAEFVKGLLKLTVVSFVGYIMLLPYFDSLEHMVGLPMPLLLDELLRMTVRMLSGIVVALLAIALMDVVYQRVEHMKKMRMSKQEIKDEYRQSEGDPHVKGRLRQLRAEKSRQRMMQAVPQADVVITNPTHFAVALKYKPEEMDAPVLVAKGADEVAHRIREIAKENKVMIVENPPLARALFSSVELDQMIPPELYKAVAEVITYVFKTQGRLKRATPPPPRKPSKPVR